MLANYLMYKNGEFPEYDRYNQEMEAHLAKALAEVEISADAWAYHYAKEQVAFKQAHPDLPHYFIGSGTQYDLFLCDVLLGGTDVGSYKIHQLPGVFPRHAGDHRSRYPGNPVYGRR